VNVAFDDLVRLVGSQMERTPTAEVSG